MSQKPSREMTVSAALDAIHKDLEDIAKYIHAASLCHGLNTDPIKDKFENCEDLLATLKQHFSKKDQKTEEPPKPMEAS